MTTLVANNRADLKKLRPYFANGFVSVEQQLDQWQKHDGR